MKKALTGFVRKYTGRIMYRWWVITWTGRSRPHSQSSLTLKESL